MGYPELSRYYFPPEDVHKELATLLITYLLFDMFNGISKPSIERLLSSSTHSKLEGTKPLFVYTCHHWDQHVLRAKECDGISEILMTLLEKRYELLKSLEQVLWQDYLGTTADGINGHARLLRFAISVGSLWLVKRVIRHSPDLIDCEIGNHETPLILATWKGHLDIINLLLDCGANVNAATDLHTPLILSAEGDREDILEHLLKRGADVNGQSVQTHQTALHIAAIFGLTNHAAILLRHKANFHARNHWGGTPLHYAVLQRNLEIVQLLVDTGSDPTLKNDDGRTPLHFALNCNLPKDHLFSRLNTSQRREELARRSVEILLSHGVHLCDIGPVSRKMVQWASSEPWYSDLILEDDG